MPTSAPRAIGYKSAVRQLKIEPTIKSSSTSTAHPPEKIIRKNPLDQNPVCSWCFGLESFLDHCDLGVIVAVHYLDRTMPTKVICELLLDSDISEAASLKLVIMNLCKNSKAILNGNS